MSLEILNLFRIPPANKAYWILHSHTKININKEDGRITILVSLLPEDEKSYGKLIEDDYISHFIKKNQNLLDILTEGGFQISISPESRIIKDSR